jgi:hypothetical protein
MVGMFFRRNNEGLNGGTLMVRRLPGAEIRKHGQKLEGIGIGEIKDKYINMKVIKG